MANASNAKTKYGVVKETVFGTTPSTPALVSQKHSSGNFTLTKEELLDDSKSGNRGYGFAQHGNKAVSGTLTGNFTHTNFDTLLETAMFGEWTSNVLKRGETRKSVTIEEAQSDINVFRQFTGVVGNGFTLEAPVDGLVTISFDFMGLEETVAGTSLDGTYTESANIQPFTHCGGTISEGGSPIAYVSSVSVSVANNIAQDYYWGVCDTGDLVPGRVEVTGTLDVFFTSAALYNKFVNKTASSLEFTLTNGTETVTFEMPLIQYNGADAPTDAGSESRMVSLPFRALLDPTEGTELLITRSA